MKITFENTRNYDSENKVYNSQIKPLVQTILNGDTTALIGYQMSSNENFLHNRNRLISQNKS